MKTDLIPPDKMEKVILESVKARIPNESRTFLCASCWKYCEVKEIKAVNRGFKCPLCNSKSIAVLDVIPENLHRLIEKGGVARSKSDKKLLEKVSATASLYQRFGLAAAHVLAGRRVSPYDAEGVLLNEDKVCDRLFKLIIEAEKEALKKRFW